MDDVIKFISMHGCYEQHIVEIKKNYETRLMTILVPNMYEGFEVLYNKAQSFDLRFKEAIKKNPNVKSIDVKKIFQHLLSKIKDLTTHKIRDETDRIKTASRSADIFDDLVKAVVRSNIVLMTYNVDSKKKDLIQTRYHDSIIVHDFVHLCYIEASRVFYTRPELFMNYSDVINNHNKRICYDIIKNSIIEAINLSLPMKEILAEYLNNPYEQKDDIKIYVMKNYNKDALDYPGDMNHILDLQNRGSLLDEQDSEYIKAQQMMNRDLGNSGNLGESMLESEKNNFVEHPPNNIFEPDKSNSDKSNSDKSNSDKSNLDKTDKTNSDKSDPDKSNPDKTNSTKDKQSSERQSSERKIRMINLNATMNGKGQAKNYFKEQLPSANIKAGIDNNPKESSLSTLTDDIKDTNDKNQAEDVLRNILR